MRKRISALLVALTMIVGGFVLTASVGADQPFMIAARTDCNTALGFLRRATADKGGYRARSVKMINSAISEINQGIAYDRNNESVFEGEYLNPVIDQPMMIKAKDALKSARENLEKATADKGGHRTKALKWVNDAIDEIQRGVDWDRDH
jgi:hypothetical protein